ncbi:F-box protein At4g22280-like [Carex rostrata]
MTNIYRHGSEENDGIDSISSLPDDVRMHILSFLSTREAVQTCILSKTWINTWASVPDLNFNIQEFGLPKFVYGEIAVAFVTKFEQLVKSVLEKRETSSVNRFQLRLDSLYWPLTQTVVDCIGDVMKLGPQECLVKIVSCEHLNLNANLIFTSASLTYLQLCLSTKVNRFVAIEPNSVNLPCLKTLNLDGVTMSDDSFKKLLLGCLLLEELVLQGCSIGFIQIFSNTLKKLVLNSSCYIKGLHISLPNLQYLDIKVMVMGEIMLLNMPLLVDASICIRGWYDHDKFVTMGPKLIHNLSNVERLLLDLGFPELVQKKDFSNCPIFNNLKRLELVTWGVYGFDLTTYFLHHSPKLQELTLTNFQARVMKFIDEEITQEGSGDILVQREFLKTVRIVGFKNDNGFVDQLINKLLVHVKIIGEIIV